MPEQRVPPEAKFSSELLKCAKGRLQYDTGWTAASLPSRHRAPPSASNSDLPTSLDVQAVEVLSLAKWLDDDDVTAPSPPSTLPGGQTHPPPSGLPNKPVVDSRSSRRRDDELEDEGEEEDEAEASANAYFPRGYFCAPSDSDSESDEGDVQSSAHMPVAIVVKSLPPPDEGASELLEMEAARRRTVQAAVLQQQAAFVKLVEERREQLEASTAKACAAQVARFQQLAAHLDAEIQHRRREQAAELEQLKQAHRREFEKDTRKLNDMKQAAELKQRQEAERLENERRERAAQQEAEAARLRAEQERAAREDAERRRAAEEAERRKAIQDAEAEARRRQEVDEKARLEKEAAERQRRQEAAAPPPVPAAVVEAQALAARLDEIEKLAATVPPEANATRLDLKKKINLAVSQISATISQVQKKSAQLQDALRAAQAASPAMYAFALHNLAARIVGQGETQVAACQSSAFPIAAVAVAVAAQHPAFTPVLLASIHKACPYTIPMFFAKRKDETVEAYRARIGYKEDSSQGSGFESEDAYFTRMTGLISLYAAIIQSPWPASAVDKHGLDRGWAWLARVLNATPRRITASSLLAFLEIAGHELQRSYGRQFRKLLNLMHSQYVPRLPAEHPASKARLHVFLVDTFRAGVIQPHPGSHMPFASIQ